MRIVNEKKKFNNMDVVSAIDVWSYLVEAEFAAVSLRHLLILVAGTGKISDQFIGKAADGRLSDENYILQTTIALKLVKVSLVYLV